jgi:hypothetical protein
MAILSPSLRKWPLLVGAAALAWASVVVTLANGSRTAGATALALAVGADSGRMLAAAASAIDIPNASDADLRRAEMLAQSAVLKEPLNVPAVRTLGLVAARRGGDARAGALFAYSEWLSRRDTATQLAMTEIAVAKGDIDGALRHYDRMLRVSVDSRALLFPILVQAAAEPTIAKPLIAILRQRPSWWAWFVSSMANDPAVSASATARVVAGIGLDIHSDLERDLLHRVLERLVRDGDFVDARVLTARASGRPVDALRRLSHGDFEADPVLPPFDWAFSEGTDIGATRDAVDGRDGLVLHLSAANGNSGEVARQLTMLPAGPHVVSFVAGDVASDMVAQPALTVRCAGGERTTLLEVKLPSAPATGRPVRASMTVPATGCDAQWVSLTTGSTMDAVAAQPWIDDIAIR